MVNEKNYGVGAFIILVIVVAIAIISSLFFGENIVKSIVPNTNYIDNNLEIVQQEQEVIKAQVSETRTLIQGLDSKFMDISSRQEERFTSVEERIDVLEEKVEELFMINDQNKTEKHVVVRGDTLWRISMKYYGTGKYVENIARYNNISNSRLIVTGQIILLPPLTQLR